MDWNNIVATWYMWLSSLNSALYEPIRTLSDGLGIPFLSAFLFGVLGTTAPCQLSTNFGALAFLTRQPFDRTATLRATAAYVVAKVLVYTVIGLIVLVTGRGLVSAAGPYMEWARKIIGPFMIVLGLAVFGVIRVRFKFGESLSRTVQRQAMASVSPAQGPPAKLRVTPFERALVPFTTAGVNSPIAMAGADATGGSAAGSQLPISATAPGLRSSFLLGVGFSLAFCPTLLLLFFGVTMTLAARSAEGFTFPAFFALGTALPLSLLVGVALKSAASAARLRKGLRRANRPLRWLGGIVLIIVGLHDTLIYWLL